MLLALMSAMLLQPATAAPQSTRAPVCDVLPAWLGAWAMPSPLNGLLRPGNAVTVSLQPITGVTTIVPPRPARNGAATRGARIDLEITSAGTYGIALDGGAWIELVRGTEALRSANHGHGPDCSTVRKIVDFQLTPGRYVIQLSGTDASEARLLVFPR
jgi:hypothetical protein